MLKLYDASLLWLFLQWGCSCFSYFFVWALGKSWVVLVELVCDCCLVAFIAWWFLLQFLQRIAGERVLQLVLVGAFI